jgi:probable HAF family extracellular repeat protein
MSRWRSFGLALLVAASLLGEAAGSAHAQRYALTDLGPGVALGPNDAGQVVGYSVFAGNPNQVATLWSGGVTTNLGTLTGWTDSFAAAINDAGTVVGYSGPIPRNDIFFNGIAGNFPVVSFYGRATSWSSGAINDLGTLSGAVGSAASGINNAGQVAGYSTFLDPVCCGGHSARDLVERRRDHRPERASWRPDRWSPRPILCHRRQ